MDNFSEFKSVHSLLMSKIAEAELLLSDIEVSVNETIIHPIKCPAVGRKEDYLRDSNSNPACAFGQKKCKYFISASFNLDGYEKNIMCSVL
jgi:hypothetical protein